MKIHLTIYIALLSLCFNCILADSSKHYINLDALRGLKTEKSTDIVNKMKHQDINYYLDSLEHENVRAIEMYAVLNNYDENYYHDKAFRSGNIVAPLTTNGSAFADVVQYDYWDNLIYVIRECDKRSIYAIVNPLGPEVYKNVRPNKGMIRIYMNLLSRILEKETNVIWRIDETIMGNDEKEIAEEMIKMIKVHNRKQLIID